MWTGKVRPTNVCASVKHVRTCEWRWDCEGELAVENRATYLPTGHLRCEWDLIPMKGSRLNGTTCFWTKPVDYQFINGGPIHTSRSIHTKRYRLHVKDHLQPIPNLWTGSLRVTGSSTCEHVCLNGSCTFEGSSTREWDGNEMSTCELILDKRLQFRRWFLHVLTRHKENYTCRLKLNICFFFVFFFFVFFFLC